MKFLRKIYNEINSDIFNGQLDKPYILCIHEPGYFGWYAVIHKRHVINIDPVMVYNYELMFATMAHEMIHQYQNMLEKKQIHGKFFKKIAEEIEEFY